MDTAKTLPGDDCEARLLAWSDRIAAGDEIDWECVRAELGETLTENLRNLAGLAGSFAAFVGAETAAATPVEPAIGARFGPYRIDAEIGRGSSGRVYRAHDDKLARHIALKVLEPTLFDPVEVLHEGQLMARIDHPNVLKVHGVVEDHGRLAYAFELAAGETLAVWAARQPTLGARELAAIGAELVAGLAALHQGGVLHGDLKPANVLRHRDGRWLIADFGSSQPLGAVRGTSGTPLYMAPERFQAPAATAASDQYSLGVLLFQLASGRYPYEAADGDELVRRIAAGQRAALLDLRPDLPPALVHAIEQACADAPEARHASVGAFARALAAAAGNATQAAAPARSPRKLVPVTIVALLLAVAATVAGLRPSTPNAGAADIAWNRGTAGGAQPLTPGGAVRVGDVLTLDLVLERPSHVYVINEDEAGARYQLFPVAESELANPLPAGAVRLPGQADGRTLHWRVTSAGGWERFYVLIADRPLPELDAQSFMQANLQAGANSGSAYAGGPERGVAGLVAGPSTGAALPEWLADLRSVHPDVRIEQYAFAHAAP